MTESRVCRACGKTKPTSQFPTGRRTCAECYTARYSAKHSVDRWFTEDGDFTCRVCGERRTGADRSYARRGYCKDCYRAYLTDKKARAPRMLTCRTCGETKPKQLFEKYSTTRCLACASRAVNEVYHRKRGKR